MESILIYGLIEGLLIALIALALSMIYSGLRILDLSIGGVYVVASYFMLSSFSLFQYFGLNLSIISMSLSLLISIALSMLLSAGIEKIIYQPFFNRNASSTTGLIVSLAIFTGLISTVALISGPETEIIPIPLHLQGSIRLGSSIILTKVQIIQFIFSFLLLIGSLFLLNKTSLGKKIIALADNPVQFKTIGLDISKTRLHIMIFAAVLIATGSILTSIDIGINPFSSGFDIVLIAAVAMILGGITNFYGVITGSIVLGILMNLTAWYLPGEWKLAVVFTVLIAVLGFKKEGFFKHQLRLEEQQ